MSTIEKALTLLELFSVQSPEIGLSAFKERTGLDKATLHRHLTALRNCGFLEQDPRSRAYRLGPAVIRLSSVREKTRPLVKIAANVLDPLAAALEELVHAALPQSKGMSSLYAVDGGRTGTRVGFDEAEILPFHATSSGTAMLAFGDPRLRAKALKNTFTAYTDQTPVALEDVEKQIAAASARGFAQTDQTFEADVCSLALPFFDHSGLASGTISVAAPSARMSTDRRPIILSKLAQAAIRLSGDLGGDVPGDLKSKWARF